jgi:transcriptional regulator with XRE-family HTH domain
MPDKQPDSEAAVNNTGREQTQEEEKAFAKALKEEFLSVYGPGNMRAFASRVKIDHGTVSRYLSGKRLPDEAFLRCLEQDADINGRHPIAPAKLQELRTLRTAALRSSGNNNYQLQATVEELEVLMKGLRLQRILDRELIDVQQHLRAAVLEEHRGLMARFEQLQHRLTAVCDQLSLAQDARQEAEAGRELAEAGRAQTEHDNATLLRQLKAASAYVQDLHAQLADEERAGENLARAHRGLQHEVSLLRRQINAYQKERKVQYRRAEQPGKAGAASAPVTAPGSTPVTESTVQSAGAAPALSPGGELPRNGEEMRWFLAAMSSLAAAVGSFLWGSSQVEPGHGWPASGIAGMATGLALLLALVPYTSGRLAKTPDSASPASPGHSAEAGDSAKADTPSDHSYGYYPMT